MRDRVVVITVPTDVTQRAEVERAVRDTLARFGQLDYYSDPGAVEARFAMPMRRS